MTKHLISTKDVAEVRKKIYDEQSGIDKLTGLPLEYKQAVCDHNHSTMYVRGVLHRQTNAVLGKIENLWKRYLAWWYSGTLSEFLRRCADYIESEDDHRYLHPQWVKSTVTKFRSLNEEMKKHVLKGMAKPEGANSKERIETFTKAMKSGQFTMTQVEDLMKRAKGLK